jgi:hypothetical protein
MKMRYLKHALIFFAVVDFSIFLVYQINPGLFTTLLPQFNIESTGNTYQRLVGNVFLMLGLARLYGAIYINEKGAITVSMWSWVVELTYTITEIFHGHFIIIENVAGLVFAPLMLAWTLIYYRKTFPPISLTPASVSWRDKASGSP